MRKIIFGLAFLSLIAFDSQGQEQTGAQILRTARTIYDQGRLHELPAILEDGFKKNRFNDTEKVEAYKILVLTYIYLEEPQKADESMLQIMRTDHFFEPIASDQIEFRNLYDKFRKYPVFQFGVRAGLNQTFVHTINNYFSAAESQGKGTYSPNIGFNIALAFEKDLGKKFVLNPELMFNIQSFTYSNSNMFMNDFKGDDPFTQVEVEVDEQFSTVTHKIVHTRAQLNLLAQYKFKETKLSESRIEPYVLAGPTIGYLLSSSFDGLLQVENNYENAGNLDNTNSYDPIAFSLMAGAGFKYKMGSIYITADVRYQYGLFNIVNEKNRYTTPENNTLRNVYLYEDNDFSLQQGMFHVGIVYPYFKPKKLKK
jgi:hypothetical protein